MIPRLKELYNKELQADLKSKLGLKNNLMVPRIVKIVLNMGLGVEGNDSKILKTCEEDLSKITGQKPITTKFKKSISNFKTRKNTKAGLKVTLRKDKMYEFVDRLVNVALPRTKDFRGLDEKGVDEMGNYTLGIKDHTIFTETSDEELKNVFGMSVTIVTSATNKEEAIVYLAGLGWPFKK